jgi:hypothetical protein
MTDILYGIQNKMQNKLRYSAPGTIDRNSAKDKDSIAPAHKHHTIMLYGAHTDKAFCISMLDGDVDAPAT